jgi:flagellar basal-body rod protein FlgB
MKVDMLDDPTLNAMGQYMTRLSKRQQLVSSNLANIDTPGYKAKDISFHATMEELIASQTVPMKATRPEHNSLDRLQFAPLEPEVFEVPGLTERGDGNNIDLDKEMLKLGETSFGYSVMSQLLRTKFRTIATSINEGRVG